jgi:hypothetical protein
MSRFGSTGYEPHASAWKRGAWLLLGLVALVGVGIALWNWKQSSQPEKVTPVADAGAIAPTPAAPVPPTASVAEGDQLVRQRGSELSSGKELSKWLAEPDILRRLVAAVNLMAEGNSPRAVLGFLSPGGDFEARRRNNQLVATPASYARYDGVAHILTSIDTGAAAKLYLELKPYLDAAYYAIGRPGKSFDNALHEAIGKLVATPIPETQPVLEESGALYVYKDASLEQLSPAQKHLLRTGPVNARAVQGWLKEFDAATKRQP